MARRRQSETDAKKKKTRAKKPSGKPEPLPEQCFDYRKAKPNRFTLGRWNDPARTLRLP
jgi:hypothetical protein